MAGRWTSHLHPGGAKSVYLSTKAAPSHRVVEVEVEVVEVEVVAPGAGVPGHRVGAGCSKSIHFDAKRPGRWRVYGHRGGGRSVYLSTKAAPSHQVAKVEVEVVVVEVEVGVEVVEVEEWWRRWRSGGG